MSLATKLIGLYEKRMYRLEINICFTNMKNICIF